MRNIRLVHTLIDTVAAAALLLAVSCLEPPATRNGSGGKGGATVAGTGTGGSRGSRTGGTSGSGTGGRDVASGTGGATGTGGGGATTTGGAGGGASAGSFTVMNSYSMGDGFKGYWYTYKDAAGSTITPDCSGPAAPCFAGASSICVSGSAAQVVMMMYAKYWGAGVGWNLNQAVAAPNPAMGASLAGKTAVTVDLDMKTTAPLRLKLKIAGEPSDYCTTVAAGSNTVPFSMFTKECWSPGGVALPAGAMVEALQLQVPSNDKAATPFDFCVTNVSFK
jgi:hypothetical protein